MKNDYKWGYNLEEDLKHLYGEDYIEINEQREKLYREIEEAGKQFQSLLQNPMPISLIDWSNAYRRLTNVIEEVTDFAIAHRLREDA